MTNYQASLVVKSVAAQLANSIIVPIMANVFIKDNIYEQNGLVQDVFILGLTNAFIPPIARITNIMHYLRMFYAYYRTQPEKRLGLHQH